MCGAGGWEGREGGPGGGGGFAVKPPQILYPPKYYTPLGLISVLPNTIPPFHHFIIRFRIRITHGANTKQN